MHNCFEYDNVNEIWRMEFGSLSEIVEYAVDGPCHYEGNRREIHEYLTEGGSFREGMTGKSAVAALTNPPVHLTRTVAEMADLLRQSIPPPQRKARKTRRNLDSGDEFDADAWARHDPDGWSETRREHVPNPSVRIGINTTCIWWMKPEHLLYRGAAAVALSDILTAQGINNEIRAFNSTRGLAEREGLVAMWLTVKPFTSPIDISAAAVALASIGFYRTIMFAAKVRGCKSKSHGSLGSVIPLPKSEREGLDILFDSDITDAASAILTVNKFVERMKEQPNV